MAKDKKIIFLDIDGVLNFIGSRTKRGFYVMDSGCVSRLRAVIEKHEAQIVVSSAWRKRDDWKEHITEAFRDAGWNTPPLIDRTSSFYVAPRGLEIHAWLKKHPEITNYVIVDDDSDMLPWQWGRFVRTSMFSGGLTDRHVQQIDDLWHVHER